MVTEELKAMGLEEGDIEDLAQLGGLMHAFVSLLDFPVLACTPSPDTYR